MNCNYVLLLLLNSQGELLLFRRINANFGNNQYCLIGGKIEAHETARQALVREAKEEVGIDIAIDDLVLQHTFHRKGTESEFFALIFSASQWQGTPVNNEPEKHADLAWFSLDALPATILPAHRQALGAIKRGLRYSEHGWE